MVNKKISVVILDGEYSNSNDLSHLLQENSMDVTAFENVLQLLKFVKDSKPDLVILNGAEFINGQEAGGTSRNSTFMQSKGCKMIMIAEEESSVERSCNSNGIIFLSKPVDSKTLLYNIQRLTSQEIRR